MSTCSPRRGGGISVSGGVLVTEPDGTVVVNAGSKSLEVRCEPGTDVIVGTMSGSIRFHGEFGAVRVATKSGKIEIDGRDRGRRAHRVRQRSCRRMRGRVPSGGDLGSRFGSGTPGPRGSRASAVPSRVDEADSAEIKTVSGKVVLGSTATGQRRDPERLGNGRGVGAARAAHRTSTSKSIAGRMRNECPEGTDGEIDVKTVSGTIRIECK